MFEAYLPSQILRNNSFIISAVRLILSITGIFEFFWISTFLTVVVIAVVDYILTLTGQLSRGQISLGLTLRVYGMVHLILQSAQGPLDFATTSLVATLMGACIMALYLCISAYTLIPITIYWMYPCIVTSCVCCLQILVFPLIYMHEESSAININLRMVPAKVPQLMVAKRFNLRKLVRRKIKTMRPFTFYAGLFDYRFHKLQRCTKLAIIESISDYTITALLA